MNQLDITHAPNDIHQVSGPSPLVLKKNILNGFCHIWVCCVSRLTFVTPIHGGSIRNSVPSWFRKSWNCWNTSKFDLKPNAQCSKFDNQYKWPKVPRVIIWVSLVKWPCIQEKNMCAFSWLYVPTIVPKYSTVAKNLIYIFW